MGVSYSEFWHLTPIKLGYIVKGFSISQKRKDEEMWRMGIYVQSAVICAIDNAIRGNKATTKYIEPLLKEVTAESTEEEMLKNHEKLFACLEMMKTNSDLEKAINDFNKKE